MGSLLLAQWPLLFLKEKGLICKATHPPAPSSPILLMWAVGWPLRSWYILYMNFGCLDFYVYIIFVEVVSLVMCRGNHLCKAGIFDISATFVRFMGISPYILLPFIISTRPVQ